LWLNQGGKPAVMTAIAKYYATETMRKIVNHGMDVVGGRAIQMGPRNFWLSTIRPFQYRLQSKAPIF
jgi:Acyl-CoA dehydrogenases